MKVVINSRKFGRKLTFVASKSGCVFLDPSATSWGEQLFDKDGNALIATSEQDLRRIARRYIAKAIVIPELPPAPAIPAVDFAAKQIADGVPIDEIAMELRHRYSETPEYIAELFYEMGVPVADIASAIKAVSHRRWEWVAKVLYSYAGAKPAEIARILYHVATDFRELWRIVDVLNNPYYGLGLPADEIAKSLSELGIDQHTIDKAMQQICVA